LPVAQKRRIETNNGPVNSRTFGPITQSKSIDASFRVAVSTEDRLAAFGLRYEVYIAEQGKPYPEADHDDRLLSDELDADGDIIVVEVDKAIIGTVRANCFSSPLTRARYAHVFELSRFAGLDMGEVVVCSRLAASTEHRHAIARGLLFEGIYEHRLIRNTKLCFATCAPTLSRMFRMYGFREYASPIRDPVVGTLHRTLLVLDDTEHLTKIGSPFASIAHRHAVPMVPRPSLNKLLDDYTARHVDI
jgi:predicted GNAT family N-acyltransferase